MEHSCLYPRRQAYHESAQALDFVSLLLSRHVNVPAQTTISPYIKQNLPLKSLDGEAVKASQVSEVDKHNQEMASIGWRMQSLNAAADSLLKSASRLEEEMGKETTYWDQVLAVKDKGWSLSRLPREKHTLGVRYGFAEAYLDFRDRGLAALRRGVDGTVSLDRGVRSKGNHKLRVRVLQQGRPIASSAKHTSDTHEDQSIEKEILDARNSIFDEELHHEIHREARNLVNQGVRYVDGRVLLPYEIDKQIEIDLIPLQGNVLDDSAGDHPIADTVAISLRVLTSHAHRQNLRNRSQMPLPLREHKVPRPIYGLLKPIMEWLQHQAYVAKLQDFLENLHNTLSGASLVCSFDFTKSAHDPAALYPDMKKTTSFSNVDALMRTLTSPLHTAIIVRLLNGDTTLAIDIHTTLQHYGTSFQVSLGKVPSTLLSTYLPGSSQFTDFSALVKQVIHLAALAVVQHLVSTRNSGKIPWRTISPHSNSIMRNRLEKGRDKEIVTINLTRSSLTFTLRRNGIAVEEATWNGVSNDLDGGVEKRALIDIFQQI